MEDLCSNRQDLSGLFGTVSIQRLENFKFAKAIFPILRCTPLTTYG
jgi:hypothetical protein